VLAIDHSQGPQVDGKFFHFAIEDVDAYLGRPLRSNERLKVRVRRTDDTGTVKLWPTNDGGSAGTAHGRFDDQDPIGDGVGYFQVGDELEIEEVLPAPVIAVLAIDHSQGPQVDGKFFHFAIEDVDAYLGRPLRSNERLKVRVRRTDDTGTVKLWPTNDGGSAGTAHGRFDDQDPIGDGVGYFQVGDELEIEEVLPPSPEHKIDELKHDSDEDDMDMDMLMDAALETEVEDDDEEDMDAATIAMLESETRDKLMQCALPQKVSAVLGDRNQFKVPAKPAVERDLRKLQMGLQDLDGEQRKYAKLSVLKYYDILFEVFRRYCKIGGDKHWLTASGWTALINDAFIADKKSETCTASACEALFKQVYDSHHGGGGKPARARQQHVKNMTTTALNLAEWNDEDPWTGVWRQDTEDIGGGAAEVYRLKQNGDRKLVGWINKFGFCDLNGSVNAGDRKQAEVMAHWHEGARQGKRRLCKCTLVKAATTDAIRITINVEWKSIAASSNVDTGGVEEGVYTMTKVDVLSHEDLAAFAFQIGLARHEYLDAMLMLAKMKYPELPRYEALSELCEHYLVEYIFGGMAQAEEATLKTLFRPYSTELHLLFGVFKGGLIGAHEWRALCADLLKQDKSAFAKGGLPSKSDIDAAFELAKDGYDLQLTYKAFEVALKNLAQRLWKKKPRMNKHEEKTQAFKLKKLLKWAVKMQKKGWTPNVKPKNKSGLWSRFQAKNGQTLQSVLEEPEAGALPDTAAVTEAVDGEDALAKTELVLADADAEAEDDDINYLNQVLGKHALVESTQL